jgi:hypothetical protein
LEPAFGNIAHPCNRCQWQLFKQQLINESFGVGVNALLLGVFDELTVTGSAFVVLLAVMDSTVLDDLLGAATGAGWG